MKLEVALSIGIMIAGVIIGLALLFYSVGSAGNEYEDTSASEGQVIEEESAPESQAWLPGYHLL